MDNDFNGFGNWDTREVGLWLINDQHISTAAAIIEESAYQSFVDWTHAGQADGTRAEFLNRLACDLKDLFFDELYSSQENEGFLGLRHSIISATFEQVDWLKLAGLIVDEGREFAN